MSENSTSKAVQVGGIGVGAALSAIAGMLTGWIVYSATAIDHHMPLPPAIDATREEITSRHAGILSSYVDRRGSGRPLLLLHSINAAASAYEMRPIFEHYCGTRPIHALDLPGYGFSERSDRLYSPELYQTAILDYMTHKLGSEPADVIALSLSSEFAGMAAQARPDLFHSLTMISPTGFSEQSGVGGAAPGQGSDIAYGLFSFPLWSQAFYDLLVTRASIDFFLEQSFSGQADQGLADYGYLSGHQPGARYAPLYFVSGKLFTPDIRQRVYAALNDLPVLVLFDQSNYTNFEALSWFMARHQNWRAERIQPTRGLPQFEKMTAVADQLEQFWAGIG